MFTGKTFHRSEKSAVDVGEGILLYDGEDSSVIASFGNRTRFLNALWIPCVLNQLTPSQIILVNRFREFRLVRDDQFKHAKTAREFMIEFVREIQPKSLLEIGCGKFPIVSDVSVERYRGIEIDGEAIQYCQLNGVEVGTLESFLANEDTSFDMIIALYAFHFNISTSLIEYLARNMVAASSCLVFNVIVDDATSVMNTLAQLSRKFPICRIYKSSILAKREFFIFMSRSMNLNQCAVLERLLDSTDTVFSS